jgi:uncharacterized membrane protein YbhN (UPF0104 family)
VLNTRRAWLASGCLWLALLAVGVAFAVARPDGDLTQAFRAVRWAAVAVVLPVQALSIALCAFALRLFRPGASYLASVYSRWLRDAGGNLFVFAPGFGEIAGARTLTLMGATAVASISASAMDIAAESLAQIPYALFALTIVPPMALSPARHAWLWWASGLGLAIAISLWAVRRDGVARRLQPLLIPAMRWLAELRGAFRIRRRAMPAATLLHLVAWATGGVQVWLATLVLGWHVAFLHAVALESLVYAARAALFFVPAGLGVQEAGFIGGGLLLGIPPSQALALSLILRVRDILIGAPALAAWPVIETARRSLGPQAARRTQG